jgi:DNA-directed RNA polymerase specialized sigma24 family protein
MHTEIDSLCSTSRTDDFDNRQLAGQILSSLSHDERFILVAREVDDISFDDLAVITGRKAGALRTQLHRLKEQIRTLFPEERFTAIEV